MQRQAAGWQGSWRHRVPTTDAASHAAQLGVHMHGLPPGAAHQTEAPATRRDAIRRQHAPGDTHTWRTSSSSFFLGFGLQHKQQAAL